MAKRKSASGIDLAQLIKWAERCRDYYDGAQWTSEEMRILEERQGDMLAKPTCCADS